MSFGFSFTARTVHSARQKLREAHAPEIVKALVEKALDQLPKYSGGSQPQAMSSSHRDGANQSPPQGASAIPEFCGVFVEASGHIVEWGDMGRSWIDRFVVQPLFD